MGFNWIYIWGLFAILFVLIINAGVNFTYAKYSKRYSASNVTGARAARLVLDQNGLQHIPIEQISGKLTDRYDPAANVIYLSEDVYNSNSIAAIGVACHEVGRAMQYATNYKPIKIRSAVQPVAYIVFKLVMPTLLAGILLNAIGGILILVYIGLFLFALSYILRLVILPMEFNAGSRAIAAICENDLLTPDELKCVRQFFFFAAMTYV